MARWLHPTLCRKQPGAAGAKWLGHQFLCGKMRQDFSYMQRAMMRICASFLSWFCRVTGTRQDAENCQRCKEQRANPQVPFHCIINYYRLIGDSIRNIPLSLMTHEKTQGAAHFFDILAAEAMRTAHIQTDVKEQRSECQHKIQRVGTDHDC